MGLFNLVKPDALQTFNTMTSNPTEEAELYSIADTFEGVYKISRLEKRAVGVSKPPRTVPVYFGKGSKETWLGSVILMKMY